MCKCTTHSQHGDKHSVTYACLPYGHGWSMNYVPTLDNVQECPRECYGTILTWWWLHKAK